MEKVTLTIEQDNLAEAWETVDTERRKAKQKYVCSQIAAFFGNLVFAALVLIAANGLFFEGTRNSYSDFLAKIPGFIWLWETFSGLFREYCGSFMALTTVAAMVVYSISFCVSAVTLLLTMTVYHPKRCQWAEGEPQAVTEKILLMARDARRYSNRCSRGGSMPCSLIFMIVQVSVLGMYAILELKDMQTVMDLATGPIMKLMEPYMVSDLAYFSFQLAVFAPSLMIYVLGIFLAYSAINQVHIYTVRFLYRYRVPYSFVAQAERMHVFVGQEENSTADTMQLLQQALEYEQLGAYGKAKQLLAEASHLGNAEAMEHYARHWLIIGAKDPARFWLEKCVESGNASKNAKKTLRRLKWHRPIRVKYLNIT